MARWSSRWMWLGSIVTAVGLAGCADIADDEDDLATDESALAVGNGQNLNGQNLNGQNLNGQNLNGSSLGRAVRWVSFDDARVGGDDLRWLWLEGSELVGWRRHHGEVRGDELDGAKLWARSDWGHDIQLRITDVQAPESGDIWHYTVQYRETNGRWYPICLSGTTPLAAIAVDGYWNRSEGTPQGGDKIHHPHRFTFACPVIGAIGKCIEIGYRPWAEVDDISLDDHHQACVRLMRADYCGNGTPHTTDGALVNLYDDLGIQFDTDPWVLEAEWDAGGARCVSPHNRGVEDVACYDRVVNDECGATFDQGTLLISETPEDD